ncbi:MAG TPA: hypothetical protein VK983_00070 [Candidatus Limnocylindrales bacterium]|nr:hypothetical protein [Candidatus Limnocylindrales bacterium]
MSNRFLPGLPLATANTHWISATDIPKGIEVQTAGGRIRAITGPEKLRLDRARAIYQHLQELVIDDCIPPSADSWHELRTGITANATEGITRLPNPQHHTVRQVDIQYAARAGLEQIVATQEVIPRMHAAVQLDNPNEYLSSVARRSAGFVVSLMALPNEVDNSLAQVLASPKPDFTADEPYEGLRFSTEPLRIEASLVVLDAEYMANRHGYRQRQRNPAKAVDSGKVSFGCPARPMGARMYQAIARAAEESYLFEQSYHQAQDVEDIGPPGQNA